jgi:hypothetical protein
MLREYLLLLLLLLIIIYLDVTTTIYLSITVMYQILPGLNIRLFHINKITQLTLFIFLNRNGRYNNINIDILYFQFRQNIVIIIFKCLITF